MIFLNYYCKAVTNNVILNDELQEFKWILPLKALDLELNDSTRKLIEKYMDISSTEKKTL